MSIHLCSGPQSAGPCGAQGVVSQQHSRGKTMAASPPPTRYQSLDAIRGVAVMGILAMNIVAFALPFSAYANPAAGGPPGSADVATWFFNFVFVDSKMRGLFSMLFGASTLLVIDGAASAGRSAAGTHYSRMFWLALFGLAHFYLLWFGDILFLYAMCGLLLFLFRRSEEHTSELQSLMRISYAVFCLK